MNSINKQIMTRNVGEDMVSIWPGSGAPLN